MISSERQLERVLSHYTLETTKRAAILFAVQRGITEKPEYMRIAISELATAKKFGKASRLAEKIGDSELANQLMRKDHDANLAEVQLKERRLNEFDDLLSKIEDPQTRRSAVVAAVKKGITNRLEHVRIVIEEYEIAGPGNVHDSQKLARSVGAVTSQICESAGWIGLAAHMSEGEGDKERTKDLYDRYAQTLEKRGKHALAAQIALYKLSDIDRTIINGSRAGNWELVAQMLRVKGDINAAKSAAKLATLLRPTE